MLSRGRTRTISPIALARKQFEEELRRRESEQPLEFILTKPLRKSPLSSVLAIAPSSPTLAHSASPQSHRTSPASPTCRDSSHNRETVIPVVAPVVSSDVSSLRPVPCDIPPFITSTCQPSPSLTRRVPSRSPTIRRIPSRHSARSSCSSLSRSRSRSVDRTPAEPVTPPDSDYAPAYAQDQPLSLEDRMQNAYAVEDMRLAKLLLLQVRGVSAHSLSDPRIDQLTDDDFEGCFVPLGGGMRDPLESDACVHEHTQRTPRRVECEQEACEEKILWRKREDWLLDVSRKWEGAKSTFRRDVITVLVERETRESQERKRLEQLVEDQRIIADERSQKKLRLKQTKAGQYSRRDGSSAMPSRSPMTISQASTSRLEIEDAPPAPLPSTSAHLQEIARIQSAGPSLVPMDVVARSMHGPLFPHEPQEDPDVTKDGPHTLARCALDVLLAPVEWEVGERWEEYRRFAHKGKSKEQLPTSSPEPKMRHSSNGACSSCANFATPPSPSLSTTTPTSLSTSGSQRSWLSFGSRNTASTALTMPIASVTSGKRASFLSTVSIAAEIRGRLRTNKHADRLSPEPSAGRRACVCWRAGLIPVAADQHPLFEAPARLGVGPVSGKADRRMVSAASMVSRVSLSARLRQSVSAVVEVAQRFQEAYVRATLISVPLYSEFEDDYAPRRRRASSPSWSRSRSRSHSRSRSMSPFRRIGICLADGRPPAGHRVRPSDVLAFLHCSDEDANLLNDDNGHASHHISLRVLGAAGLSATAITTTTSHMRVFEPLPSLTRSPLKPRFPPQSPEQRVRPVGNHVHLRLVALGNVCAQKGVPWESARGVLATGQERVRGLAVEGIGRSKLARECGLEEQRGVHPKSPPLNVPMIPGYGRGVSWRRGVTVPEHGRSGMTAPRRRRA